MKKTRKLLNEFKEFISKGSVIDMAVAVIIGGASTKIVTSLVNNLIMPLISLVLGGANMADWKFVISPASYAVDGTLLSVETSIGYGAFLGAVIDFLIIAFCVFILLKVVLLSKNTLSKFRGETDDNDEKEKEEKKSDEILILEEIRDLLKENKENKL